MPRLVQACAESDNPDLACSAHCRWCLLCCVAAPTSFCCWRTPPALVDLVVLCGASPWISEQLAAYPVLLDELLDRASLYTAPDKGLLAEELRQQLTRLPLDDLEAHMDGLRYFKAAMSCASLPVNWWDGCP